MKSNKDETAMNSSELSKLALALEKRNTTEFPTHEVFEDGVPSKEVIDQQMYSMFKTRVKEEWEKIAKINP